MDAIRFGLSLRALRRRRGWTQREVASRSAFSRAAISRIERGEGDRLSVRTLDRVADALGGRIAIRALWQGEELDRLLDREHARLVELIVARLTAAGWVALPEVTYRIGYERGSIDVFAEHPGTRNLLVVEVKSVVPDIQAMLAGLDRKARLAPDVARERGWPPGPVSRLLVLPDAATARRRPSQFQATFATALPARTVEVRRWIAEPDRPLAGIMFLSDATHTGIGERFRRARSPVVHERS